MDHFPPPPPSVDLTALGLSQSPPPSQVGSALLRWRGDQPVVLLAGDIDLAMTRQLTSVGRMLRSQATPVVTDAFGVSFLDASGLRAVLSLAAPGEPVAVQRPSAAVLRLVQVVLAAEAGLDAVWTTRPTPAATSAPTSGVLASMDAPTWRHRDGLVAGPWARQARTQVMLHVEPGALELTGLPGW